MQAAMKIISAPNAVNSDNRLQTLYAWGDRIELAQTLIGRCWSAFARYCYPNERLEINLRRSGQSLQEELTELYEQYQEFYRRARSIWNGSFPNLNITATILSHISPQILEWLNEEDPIVDDLDERWEALAGVFGIEELFSLDRVRELYTNIDSLVREWEAYTKISGLIGPIPIQPLIQAIHDQESEQPALTAWCGQANRHEEITRDEVNLYIRLLGESRRTPGDVAEEEPPQVDTRIPLSMQAAALKRRTGRAAIPEGSIIKTLERHLLAQ